MDLPEVVPLRKELVPYLFKADKLGLCLQHPLVYCVMYHPTMASHMNMSYEYKSKALTKAFDTKDWHDYTFLHERPHRYNALIDVMDEITNDTEYWELVSSVWIDTENQWQWGSAIPTLLEADRGDRLSMMEESDREHFYNLPEVFTVYRGYDRSRNGWSWTLDHERAVWFARRWSSPKARVVSGQCRKSDVIALFAGRGEWEIVINPTNVFNKKTEVL